MGEMKKAIRYILYVGTVIPCIVMMMISLWDGNIGKAIFWFFLWLILNAIDDNLYDNR